MIPLEPVQPTAILWPLASTASLVGLLVPRVIGALGKRIPCASVKTTPWSSVATASPSRGAMYTTVSVASLVSVEPATEERC